MNVGMPRCAKVGKGGIREARWWPFSPNARETRNIHGAEKKKKKQKKASLFAPPGEPRSEWVGSVTVRAMIVVIPVGWTNFSTSILRKLPGWVTGKPCILRMKHLPPE